MGTAELQQPNNSGPKHLSQDPSLSYPEQIQFPSSTPPWIAIIVSLIKTVGISSVFAGVLLWGGWQLSERVIDSHVKFLDQTSENFKTQAESIKELEHSHKALSLNQAEIASNQNQILQILNKQTQILEKWSK